MPEHSPPGSPAAMGQTDVAMPRRASEGDLLEGKVLPAARQASGPSRPPGAQLPVDEDEYVSRMAHLEVQDTAPPRVDYRYGYQAQGEQSYQSFAIPSQPAYPLHIPPSPAYANSHMRAHRTSLQPNAPPLAAEHGMFYQAHLPTELYMEGIRGTPAYATQPLYPQSNRTSPVESPSGYIQPPPGFQPPAMLIPPGWGSPMMSPVMPTQAVNMGGMGNMGPGGHVRQQGYMDEFGAHRGVYTGATPGATWASGSTPTSYTFYTPYQQQAAAFEHQPGSEGWSVGTSPILSQAAFPHRQSWQGPALPNHRANRMSWSGPSRAALPSMPQLDKTKERRAYHPQPPARRSDYVMWVGNVPQNTSHEELWRFFNDEKPVVGNPELDDLPWRGPSSIFLISRSSCAFVNLSTQEDLDRAVIYFHGKALRPADPRCPRMVCRVRRKDDDLRAGVGAQRGTGMHRQWVKEHQEEDPKGGQEATMPPQHIDISGATEPPTPNESASSVPPSPAALEGPPDGEGRRRESIVAVGGLAHHKSSASYASTNSSFLLRNFPKRIFILKSTTTAELEDSVRTGTWRTQRHNEPILDQAFRTSKEVFLVFGANRSGEFFGYAKMVEHIDKERVKAKALAAASVGKVSSAGSGSGSGSSGSNHYQNQKIMSVPQPERIQEEPDEDRHRAGSDPIRPTAFLSPRNSRAPVSSPGQLSPAEEYDLEDVQHADGEALTDPTHHRAKGTGDRSNASAPVGLRKRSPSPNALQLVAPQQPSSFPLVEPTAVQQALGGSDRPPIVGDDGILRKDTVLTPHEREQREAEHPIEEHHELLPDAMGFTFKIEWIKTASLPFYRLRHLRNPWNADREVKVSRDGTEVEPVVGCHLMAEWDKLDGYASGGMRVPTSQAGYR